MKTKYLDITPYPFLYRDKSSLIHCSELDESPNNCYKCSCSDCYANCKPTKAEFQIMNGLHGIERSLRGEK